MIANDLAVSSAFVRAVPYRTFAELAEAFFICAALLSPFLLGWRTPEALRKRLALPLAARIALMSLFIGSVLVFVLSASLDASGYNPMSQAGGLPGPPSHPAFYGFVSGIANAVGLHSLVSDWAPASSVQGYSHFGLVAALAWSVSVVSIFTFRARRGIAAGLHDAIAYAVSTVILFEVGLLILDREFMTMQVANFASFQALGFPILSNWTALALSVSAGAAIVGRSLVVGRKSATVHPEPGVVGFPLS